MQVNFYRIRLLPMKILSGLMLKKADNSLRKLLNHHQNYTQILELPQTPLNGLRIQDVSRAAVSMGG